MPTIFAVYNAKDAKIANDYEAYAKEKKIPFARALPAIKSFEIYQIDGVLGPGVAEPQNSPTEPLYQFVAKIEVTSLEDFGLAMQTPAMQALVQEYSPFLDPSTVFTMGHRIEPGA